MYDIVLNTHAKCQTTLVKPDRSEPDHEEPNSGLHRHIIL